MGPVTSQHTAASVSEETTDLSVTQQEDTTLPVSLHDSESRVTEPSTMEGLQMASSFYVPIAEISSLATNPESLQQWNPPNLKTV